jgi:hypothetical protein
VTLWQVNLPCESLQKNFLTCDNYDSVIYGRALTPPITVVGLGLRRPRRPIRQRTI